MKKSFFEVLTLVVVLAVTGCRQAGAPEALPVIDLSKDYPEKEFVAQDLFDVEYVPLETNDEFLVGGFVLAVSGHYIVTVDPMHEVGSIILFDRRTGKGLLKMNQLGKGPEDYSCADDVIPDDANDELFVIDSAGRKIQVYSMRDGSFRRSLPYAAEADYGFVDNYDEQHLMVYDKSIYLKDGEPRDKPYYHFLISKTDGKVVRPLPVSFDEIHAPVSLRRENGRMVSMLVSHLPAIVPNRGNWLLVETSSDTVYNYLTDGQRMEPFLLRKTTEDFDRMLGIGVMADRYWFMERVITKEMEQGSTTISFSDIFQVSNLVYDRREGRCYTSLVRNVDFVRGEDDLVDLCAFPVNSGDVAAFLPMMAHRLVAAYEDGKLNDGPLEDLASRLDAEDNPVLMLMKYKK